MSIPTWCGANVFAAPLGPRTLSRSLNYICLYHRVTYCFLRVVRDPGATGVRVGGLGEAGEAAVHVVAVVAALAAVAVAVAKSS